MSPRNPALNQKMREQAQERILRAAAELFAELGFERATIAQIAERAGVGRGLVSYYFASKDLLVVTLHEGWWSRWVANLEAELAELPASGAPAAVLGTLIDAALLHLDEEQGVGRLLWSIWQQPATRAVLLAHGHAPRQRTPLFSRWRDALAELAVEDPDLELLKLVATLNGALQAAVDDPEGYPLEALAAHLRRGYNRLAQDGGLRGAAE